MKDYQNISDNQLVEFSKKNPDDFGELIKRYQNQLFHYVKRISYFSNEDIEDILQNVFIKIYKNLNNFDQDLKFSTWAYQITRNTTIDNIRSKQARPQTVDLEQDDLERFFQSGESVERNIFKKDDWKKIKKIIYEMPFKYREILVLKFLEEKSYEEIMDILKKPKGSVATLISRGRKLLEKELEKNNLFLEKLRN
ncbi:MAG: sigma-70 family RNA polymerase sigma factor [Candidatus Moranbacteria bacterium]|nr:sigma-70 family RNA polymerase sigma factor [Candidatus Moranbacteria bacterium]